MPDFKAIGKRVYVYGSFCNYAKVKREEKKKFRQFLKAGNIWSGYAEIYYTARLLKVEDFPKQKIAACYHSILGYVVLCVFVRVLVARLGPLCLRNSKKRLMKCWHSFM